MDAKKFVEALRYEILEDNYNYYLNALNTAKDPKDPIWKGILPVYRSLSEDEKIIFLKFLRLIQAGTLSYIFGVLDGSSTLVEGGVNFILKSDESDQVINGDLLDTFWELEQEE